MKQVQIAIAKTNQDYGLVLNRLYLYYDMKLVMVWHRQSKEFNNTVSSVVQPYTQTKIDFISIETVQYQFWMLVIKFNLIPN